MSRTRVALLALLLVTTLVAARVSVRTAIRLGNEAFRQGDVLAAETFYSDAARRRPDSGAALFNLAEASYAERRYLEAADRFKRSAALLTTPLEQSSAHYNRGNALFRLDELQGAVGAYEDALRLNPADEDARFNLDLAAALLRERQRRQLATSGASPMTPREAEQLLGSLGPGVLKTPVHAERESSRQAAPQSSDNGPDK